MLQYLSSEPLLPMIQDTDFCIYVGSSENCRAKLTLGSKKLKYTYGNDSSAMILPMEQMGYRDILARDRTSSGPGRETYFSSKGQVILWSVGPIKVARNAVIEAVKYRDLDRVVVSEGSVPRHEPSTVL